MELIGAIQCPALPAASLGMIAGRWEIGKHGSGNTSRTGGRRGSGCAAGLGRRTTTFGRSAAARFAPRSSTSRRSTRRRSGKSARWTGGWVLYTAAVVADWYPGPLRLQGYDLVPFPPEKLRGFVGRLMSVSVPVAPHLNDMGCVDGTVTRLTLFGDLFSCVRFQWWSDYPPGWAPLVRMADEMIAAFGGRPVDE
jgi:hypothetical protein